MRHTYGALIAAAALAAGCGGGSSSKQGNGSCTPGQTATVNITASGVSPQAVCVLPNGTVTFNNSDTTAHDIETSGACAELNLGSIAAGQSATAMFPTTATCTFQDTTHAGNAAFQGTVAVSTSMTTGPGY